MVASCTGSLEQLPPAPVLQRDLFCETLQLKALRIPKKDCNKFRKLLSGFVLDKPRLRSILPEEGRPDTRLLLLAESVQHDGLEEIRGDVREQILQDSSVEVVTHELTLDYPYWTTEQVLRRLLPEGCEVPSSYECVGHIAHVNLRKELLPYKHVIGQVLLDKNAALRTVVNKVGTIDNEYRVFQMEVLAGEPDLVTEVKQHTARFRLDYGEVYWNSRLEQEHRRLTDTFSRGQVVVDMMAGIGPFAIPAAQRGCKVFANDLNPSSYHWLQVNVKLNKVSSMVNSYCMDGRDFVRLLCARPLHVESAADRSNKGPAEQQAGVQAHGHALHQANGAAAPGSQGPSIPEGGLHFDHVVMNLPASAIEFLDVFGGCLDRQRWVGRALPTIHCYTFARAGETDADILARAEGHLGGPLSEDCHIHMVRDVAPNKRMFCLSFQLPAAVAFRGAPLQAGAAAVASRGAPLQARAAAAVDARESGTAQEHAAACANGLVPDHADVGVPAELGHSQCKKQKVTPV